MKTILLWAFSVICAILIIPAVVVLLFFVVWYSSIIFPVMVGGWILSYFNNSEKKEIPYIKIRHSNLSLSELYRLSELEKRPSIIKRAWLFWSNGLRNLLS